MKRLHFDYTMNISYTIPVSVCNYTIKCIPRSDARQKLLDYKIELIPDDSYSKGKDSFGNEQIYGCIKEPHDTFMYHIEGEVEIEQILYEEYIDEDIDMMHSHSYNLNKPGEKIKEYYNSLNLSDEMSDYEKCIFIMKKLNQELKYEKNVTNITTTAEEAFELRKGVCQDYAHVMIALVHLAGIKARYVTGMLEGEGASHAWVEILWKDKWIGMDPTNNVLVADSHIKLCHGRDASDCMINRGVMRGGGMQSQAVDVTVKPLEDVT